MYHRIVITVFVFAEICWGQVYDPRGPPRVETQVLLLDSFIPAGMQIIAHITELMKFDLKPQTGPTYTTTPPPTSSHKPAIYAPDEPPGPEIYFKKGLSYEEYVERLMRPSGENYFNIYYKYPLEETVESIETEAAEVKGRSFPPSNVYEEVPQHLEAVFGKVPSDLLRLVNTIEEVDVSGVDVDKRVQEFSQIYDDSDFRFLLLRQKKKPPTRAYVSLLFLYDLLNKESKKLGLNKYNGYSQNVLNKLAEISTGTSADQLREVLSQIKKRKDTKNQQILKKIDELLKDLEQDSSYINAALRYIPPLSFVL